MATGWKSVPRSSHRPPPICWSTRPDRLFESGAGSHRERAIAVVLSGSGLDGAMGVKAIKKTGGTVIVQEPSSSEFRGMPDAAAEQADFILPLGEIAGAIVSLVGSGK